ncbi:MAG: hypothetical protein R3C05_10025 [Pirellulaceae bacterium]
MTGWHPVTHGTPQSSGEGFPLAMWQLSSGQAAKVVSSGRDFLYFDVLLRGDFVVEAFVSGFNYRETQLGYGGTWVGPHTITRPFCAATSLGISRRKTYRRGWTRSPTERGFA